MLIKVQELTKFYRTREGSDVHALDHVNFNIEEGEFITVVGPSGCGKSTLLKILAGILPKSQGEVILKGNKIDGPRRDIGVVFQSPVLLPWRTVLENIMVPVEIQGLDHVAYRKKAGKLLELTGLDGFENKYPFELSGVCNNVSVSAGHWFVIRRFF